MVKLNVLFPRLVVNPAGRCFPNGCTNRWQEQFCKCAFYRRLRSRLGTPKAITATAHKLARIFYRLWTTGGNYQDPGMDYYEQLTQERVINNLHKKALALGFELIPHPEANTVS